MTRSLPCAACPDCDARLPVDADWQARFNPPTIRCDQCETPLVPVHSASVWRRASGALIDAFIVGLCGYLAFMLIGLAGVRPQLMPSDTADAWLRFAALPATTIGLELAPVLIIAIAYLTIFTTLRGQTPGMKIARIHLVDPVLRAPSYGRSVARALLQIFGYLFGAINVFWVLIDRERRALHDRLANTLIIQRGNL